MLLLTSISSMPATFLLLSHSCLLHFTWINMANYELKNPLCSHIDRFMFIVSKMRDGK